MADPFKQQGAFSWCELMTTDPAAAKDFYVRLFGWELEEMSMEGMTYTVVKAGGEAVGGIMAMPAEAQGIPPHWGSYVTVADVDATARKAQELGGKVLVPPLDIPGVGRFSVLQDPQGAVISAITYVMK
jgi:predicted enzyme related to lactoylglutathione lyase